MNIFFLSSYTSYGQLGEGVVDVKKYLVVLFFFFPIDVRYVGTSRLAYLNKRR